MFRSNFIRLAVAVSLVGLIGSMLPHSDGTALAADIYTPSTTSATSGLIQGAVFGLFAIGVVDSLGAVHAVAAAPIAGAVGGGGSAAVPPIAGIGQKPIYDVTGADQDLSAFYKDETLLQDNGVSIGTKSSKDVLKAAAGNSMKYTVFAPIDSAIAAISPAAAASPLNPQNATGVVSSANLATTAKLFAYHIIPSQELSINDLKQLPGATTDPGAQLMTMDGSSLYVKFTPGASPNDMGILQVSNAPFGSLPGALPTVIANVHQTDERASNGVVHPIDAVLIPASLTTPAG